MLTQYNLLSTIMWTWLFNLTNHAKEFRNNNVITLGLFLFLKIFRSVYFHPLQSVHMFFMVHGTRTYALTVLHREWLQFYCLVSMSLRSVNTSLNSGPNLALSWKFSERSASLIGWWFKACYASRMNTVASIIRTASRRSRRIRPSLRREQYFPCRFSV